MTYAELSEQIIAEYPDVRPGKMFSMPCLKLNGKVIAGDWRGNAVFKLSVEHAEAALTIEGAERFSPAEGHTMKQWIVIPAAQSDCWIDLGRQAVADRAQV